MSIVYRQELGRELTWSEADNNFAELKAGVDSKKSNFDVLPVTQGGTGQTSVDAVKVAFDIATKTELASSAAGKGAEMVAYHGATVEAALNERLPEIGTYALLRAYAGPVTAFMVRAASTAFDGGFGVFRVDSSDTATADNSQTVLVDAIGRRWKRNRFFDDMEAPIAATSSMAQTGPMIVNVTNKLRISDSEADAAYNTAVMQDVLAGLPYGAEIELPARGYAYINGGLEITSPGLSIRGRNSGSAYDSFWIKSASATQDLFIIKSHGFHAFGVIAAGKSNPSTGFGNDVTHDCFSFDLPVPDADAVLTNCGILFFRDCITVKSAAARNIKVQNSLLSGSSRAFSYTHASAGNTARDFEFYNNRYHGIGLAEHTRASIFYVDPASNARGLIISGGMADFCVEVMRGYASSSEIRSLTLKGAERGYASMDATGHTSESGSQIGFSIENAKYIGKDSRLTSRAQHAIQLDGAGQYYIDGFLSHGSGGHGIYVAAPHTIINNIEIHNASQYADNTYSGVYVAATAYSVEMGGALTYRQDVRYTSANKAKYAVENMGSDTLFKSRMLAQGVAAGKEYYIDPAKKSYGPDPVSYAYSKRETRGTAAPTTGTWSRGDICWNTDPSAAGASLWECVTGGTPGTWKFLTLSA